MPRNDKTGQWETYGGVATSGGGRPAPGSSKPKGGK
jgi:hypothetical protein